MSLNKFTNPTGSVFPATYINPNVGDITCTSLTSSGPEIVTGNITINGNTAVGGPYLFINNTLGDANGARLDLKAGPAVNDFTIKQDNTGETTFLNSSNGIMKFVGSGLNTFNINPSSQTAGWLSGTNPIIFASGSGQSQLQLISTNVAGDLRITQSNAGLTSIVNSSAGNMDFQTGAGSASLDQSSNFTARGYKYSGTITATGAGGIQTLNSKAGTVNFDNVGLTAGATTTLTINNNLIGSVVLFNFSCNGVVQNSFAVVQSYVATAGVSLAVTFLNAGTVDLPVTSDWTISFISLN